MSSQATTPAVAPRARLARRAGPRVLLLVNPGASRLRKPDGAQAAANLTGAFSVTTVRTEERGHATELARRAARDGFDLVAVLGGDGTVSEAANGLAGSDVALAALPAGVTNVFARSLGTPRDSARAAARLAAAASAPGGLPSRAVDLGTVAGRHFLFTAGVGLSACLAAAADDPAHKARFGQLQFWRHAGTVLGRYLREAPRMRLEAEGRTGEGVTAMVQNSHALTYFGPREIRMCGAAGLDTGTLSVTLLRRARLRDVPAVFGRLASGRPGAVTTHPEVEGFARVRSAVLTGVGGAALPVEADGEFLGRHERVVFGVAPSALRVVG